MKISILTPDFSHNCFGRAWLLAKILKKNYEVEVIGPAFGKEIWKPLRNVCDFDIKMVKGHPNGSFELKKMLGLISGDVIYASKPLISSFGVALIKKLVTGKPVVLDIDDWEPGFGKEFYDSLRWQKKINDFRKSIFNFNSYYYTVVLNKFIRFADTITVSGNVLHSQYGGTIIYHGRDVDTFNPDRFCKSELKIIYLPNKSKSSFVVCFIGTPRPHKGIEDVINAIGLLRKNDLLLLIVGMKDNDYCNSLRRIATNLDIKENIVFFPEQPFGKLPEFISISDLVVIPQRKRAASYGQTPAKIFDAMAMEKPIIATNISGIPEILEGCGWIIEPESPTKLAKAIQYAFNNPSEAIKMGLEARKKCKQNYSWDILEKRLMKVFEKYK